MKIVETRSEWRSSGTTRLTIIANDGEGKIQVDLLNRDNKEYGRTAYIWDLYVKEDCRRKGIAKELMQYALKRAKEFGFTSATLEWVLEDTPREIAYWYASLGFDDKEFSDTYSLMVKQLTADGVQTPTSA